MRILYSDSADFNTHFDELLNRGSVDIDIVSDAVYSLLSDIKCNGDAAILKHIARFDAWSPVTFDDVVIDKKTIINAYNTLDSDTKDALKIAFDRISSFHTKQKMNSWIDFDSKGTMLGVKISPIHRAGLYIPGGKAAYPSSLLMNAVPAIVAGVKEIAICTPTPKNEPNNLLLAAIHMCDLDEVYKVGGASAIGLMAYGTQSVKRVDVITGPGNIYVACAKKLVFGNVNIDMIAGPSEVVVIADGNANARYIAIDLLSQAEHDEMATSILITHDAELALRVKNEIEIELGKLSRSSIASESIHKRGAIIVTGSILESVDLSNKIAPEHLEIMCDSPHDVLPYIHNAGAIFLGKYTPEAMGDYIAGPNHTLPTGGSARFFSPLSIDHFVKKSSIISFSKEGIRDLGLYCALLAKNEGLEAHEKSINIRFGDIDGK